MVVVVLLNGAASDSSRLPWTVTSTTTMDHNASRLLRIEDIRQFFSLSFTVVDGRCKSNSQQTY